jgi:hypothetical protein
MKKAVLALATAAVVGFTALAAPSPAEAHWRGRGFGPGLAGGLIAAAVIGGLASSAYAYGPGYYGGYAPVYPAYAPVYPAYYGGYAPAYYGYAPAYYRAPVYYAPRYRRVIRPVIRPAFYGGPRYYNRARIYGGPRYYRHRW